MVRRILSAGLIGLALCFPGCDKAKTSTSQRPAAGSSAGRKLVIAVIPKSVEHTFWKTVEAGARQGERETGCEIRWQGANTEADVTMEMRIMEDMITQGVDAICVAPSNSDALVDVISNAHKKMPVIIFDSGAKTEDYTAFIATDNRRGGEIAGQYMLKLLGDAGGKVGVMRGDAGSQSTTEREEGFISAVKMNSKVQVVDVRGENETAQSQRAAADLLQRDPDLVGFFGCSEPASKGVMLALEDSKAAGKIKFIGFDGGSELAAGMDRKEIDALVVQRPVLMGTMAVRAAVAACRGEKVEKIQKIEPQLITQQNKDQSEIRELLVPKIK
jgi:ribose transport system substrate-binding protein